ncbi:hypothetical protein [Aliivibrio fischeri]|uniref:Uncharacterized protein n=1 Tax=Aliivibrio fischeri TaxID=668 RepID=A0A510UIN5_ALIFS|nr:hypothetical protein [Aliivibrio fischeri]GEK13221.1 hypothetical protein AFI02nite_12570 [Aliivibrio fischeri]
MKKIVALIFVLIVIGAFFYGHMVGSEATELRHTKIITSQTIEAQKKERQLDQALTPVKQEAARKVANVDVRFVPIEKEVIRYVTREKIVACKPDYSKWMQLHNRATNESTKTDTSGRITNDPAAGATTSN